MALETASNILELNPAWPLGTDPVADGDDHIRLLKTVIQALYPIGSIVTNTSGTNPGSYIGGTWEPAAAGRVIVGVGDNGEATWAAAEERGSETHSLTGGEMPSHTHSVNPPSATTNTTGSHSHTYNTFGGDGSSGEPGGDGSARTKSTNSAGSHSHTVNIPSFTSGSAGSGDSHPNVQPSVAMYHWERTA